MKSFYFFKINLIFSVVEPLVMFTSAYFSFICAETIHWSGIISLIGCGIAQKRYAFKNISEKSLTTVKYGVKTMSALADVIIFLFLGIVVISKEFGHFPKKILLLEKGLFLYRSKTFLFYYLCMYDFRKMSKF